MIFHRGCGRPPYQAEKTVDGGGEVNLNGPGFPLKRVKSHKHQSGPACVFMCVVKRCRQLVLFHGQQCMDEGGEGYSQVKPTAGQSTFALGNSNVSVLYACLVSACLTFYSGTLLAGTLHGVLVH